MSAIRAEIVAEARRWVGTPYRHQASAIGVGCDCLGLVRGVWRALDGREPEHIPAYSADWAEASRAETMLEAARRHMIEVAPAEAREGDVLLFRWRDGMPAKHVAIVAEVLVSPAGQRPATPLVAGRIVHAYDAARFVAEGNLANEWRKRIVAAFSFPFLEAER